MVIAMARANARTRGVRARVRVGGWS